MEEKFGEQQSEQQSFSSLDDIEASLGDVREFFVVTLDSGHSLKCRHFNDASLLIKLQGKAEEGVKIAKTAPPDSWKPFLPADEIVVGSCIMLSEIVVEPPITIPKALEWAKTRAPLYVELAEKVVSSIQGAVVAAEVAGIDTEKNA